MKIPSLLPSSWIFLLSVGFIITFSDNNSLSLMSISQWQGRLTKNWITCFSCSGWGIRKFTEPWENGFIFMNWVSFFFFPCCGEDSDVKNGLKSIFANVTKKWPEKGHLKTWIWTINFLSLSDNKLWVCYGGIYSHKNLSNLRNSIRYIFYFYVWNSKKFGRKCFVWLWLFFSVVGETCPRW